MDVIFSFSEQAIELAIGRLSQTDEDRRQMRIAVKMVVERGYAAVDPKRQDIALAVFLAAGADDISVIN